MNTTTKTTTTEERLLANRAAIREEIAACGARVRALLRDSEALQPEQGQAIADAQALADHMAGFVAKHGECKPWLVQALAEHVAAFVAKHGEFKQWCAEVKA